ncbi:DUF5305 domain-containing protein [Halobacteria archaeon AArc-dxtr1]|nr:DUF5305 domain-containing protein [Halobacteria archaeon AArc-dxtr1]
MNINSGRLIVRARTALDEWFVLVVVALLALSLFGGWAAYGAVGDDSTDEQQRTVDAWSTTGDFEHGAEVREENDVFAVGEHLEDRSLYYTEVMPILEGEFTYAYDAPSGDVAVDVDLVRVVRSVDGEDGEHWSVEEPLASESEDGVGPGEEQTATFDANVSAMDNEATDIEEGLGSSEGTLETVVFAHVSLEGSIDGESVEHTDEYELVVDADGDTYALTGPEDSEYVEQRTELVSSTDSDPSTAAFGPLAVLLGALVALGAICVAKYRGVLAPDQQQLELIATDHERERFADWISRGTLPETVCNRPQIGVASLEELVDVAIDCDRRVIEDRGGYYVIDGDVIYHHEPPATHSGSRPNGTNSVGSTDTDADATDERTN